MRWLGFILLALIVGVLLYRRCSMSHQKWFQIGVFGGLLSLEVVKQLYLLWSGQYNYWSPPLHLCGLGLFMIGWHVFWPNRTTATLLYSLTLPGAAIALLFPGWANDPVGSFLHIHSFIFHLLLVLYVAMLLSARQLCLYVRDLWRSALFLIVFVPLVYMYNGAFQTNFMFLNAPVKGTPLQWLYEAFGASGYLVSLAIVVLLLWVFLYIPVFKRERREKDV